MGGGCIVELLSSQASHARKTWRSGEKSWWILMRGFGFAFDLSLGPSQNPAQLFKDPAQLFNHKSIIS